MCTARGSGLVPSRSNTRENNSTISVNIHMEDRMAKHAFFRDKGGVGDWINGGPVDKLLMIEGMNDEQIVVVLQSLSVLRGPELEYQIRDVENTEATR